MSYHVSKLMSCGVGTGKLVAIIDIPECPPDQQDLLEEGADIRVVGFSSSSTAAESEEA